MLKSVNDRYFIAAGDIDGFHFLSSKEKTCAWTGTVGHAMGHAPKKNFLSLLTCDVEFTHKQAWHALRELAS